MHCIQLAKTALLQFFWLGQTPRWKQNYQVIPTFRIFVTSCRIVYRSSSKLLKSTVGVPIFVFMKEVAQKHFKIRKVGVTVLVLQIFKN